MDSCIPELSLVQAGLVAEAGFQLPELIN